MKGLVRKTVMRAQTAPGNAVSFAAACLASGGFGNPLPLILWGLGSGMWTLTAFQSGRYTQCILDDERAALTEKAASDRAALQQRIVRVLTQSRSFCEWIVNADMPDYPAQYNDLLDLQRRIAQVLRGRGTQEFLSSDRILRQLDAMLTAYLKFVWSRIAYLQLLTGAHVDPELLEAAPAAAEEPPAKPSRIREFVGLFVNTDDAPQQNAAEESRGKRRGFRAVPYDLTTATQDVEERIAELRAQLTKHPTATATYEGHIALLEKRLAVLTQAAEADTKVAAQLAVFSDWFELIRSQVNATQYDANGIVTYMDSLATEVRETEQFAAAMRPADNAFSMDISMLGVSA